MKDDAFSYANLANAAFLEDLYRQYQEDPVAVDPTWRYFFSGMEFSFPRSSSSGLEGDVSVFRLIDAYRTHGHKKALSSSMLDPQEKVKELELSRFGFKEADLSSMFSTFGLLPEESALLSQIIERLESIYCSTIGFDFMGAEEKVKDWIIAEIEGKQAFQISKEEKIRAFEELCRAEVFESFLHKKYPGQVRFSLEGGESFIPLMNSLIEEGVSIEAKEFFIGMAHRGRLNVLVHVLKKAYQQIFHAFEDTPGQEGAGDVKYHRGAHSNLEIASGKFAEVALASNPSHLESVDPIVEGQSRAKQELKGSSRSSVIPILIHGDASVAGQGVVYEILQMNKLEGYTTGGTIHIVINNHIGYTTFPKDSRSTLYCTDIAKTFGAPVFHVNAEDPEQCMNVAKLAIKIRQTFQVDVFIDLGCYRKYGHNEGDEPTYTQPQEYKKIRSKKKIWEMYQARLEKEGVLSEGQGKEVERKVLAELEAAVTEVLAHSKEEGKEPQEEPEKRVQAKVPEVSEKTLEELAEKITAVPEGFQIHSKLDRMMQERRKMINCKNPDKACIDWGMGEHLAFATLLSEKIHMRLSGQDVGRGTFSHRHGIWIDQEKSSPYIPLNHISSDQAMIAIYNSFLSEFAVMGFDLGYSLVYPHSLVIWEAQFGDFANGAQVIIDQYLATAEKKWAHRSNFTLLLPHGYEGKGPEHSSARLERFLQLCAEENMIVANCTTPAQFFHLLRRQAYLQRKRPLVVFTPKALLRHPACVSSLKELSQGSFQEVLKDPAPPEKVSKVLFCCGKVFYDLIQEREKRNVKDCLIIRIEQVYPFPENEIREAVKGIGKVEKVYWVQEEPENMGAWSYVRPLLESALEDHLVYIGRDKSASPAAGSFSLHKKQYETFIQQAFE